MSFDQDWANEEAWSSRAACIGMPITMFYSEEGSRRQPPPDEKRARRLCAVCPVRLECLNYAITHDSAVTRYGTRTAEKCPACHDEADECLEPDKHAPHPFKHECRACEGAGEVPKQKIVTVAGRAWGIWGGHNAAERTHKNIRHYPGCKCASSVPKLSSCRPLDEQVSLLEELFVTRVRQNERGYFSKLPKEETA